MANKKLVVANWKMNPQTVADAKKIFTGTKRYAKKFRKVNVVVCPPFLYIANVLSSGRGAVSIGAQDVFWEPEGSFTGEISPIQLAKEKIDYCIVGHSERRARGETDEEVNKKVKALLKVGLIPVVCVGESERDDDGKYLSFIKDQIKKALKDVKQNDLQNVVIAYEPIWAIGTGIIPTSKDLFKTIDFIKSKFKEKSPKVLYGGSVNPKNINDLKIINNIDGFLIGGASQNVKKFIDIVQKTYS